MTYFKILSIVFGGLMIVGGLWVFWGLEWWRRILVKIYPEKKPAWIFVIFLFFLALGLWTWYQFFQAPNLSAFVVTLVVSLTSLKVAAPFFFYSSCRELVMGLMTETVALRVIMGSSTAMGIALLALGFFF